MLLNGKLIPVEKVISAFVLFLICTYYYYVYKWTYHYKEKIVPVDHSVRLIHEENSSKVWDDFPFTLDLKCLQSPQKSYEENALENTFDYLETDEGKELKTILAWHHAYSTNFYFGYGQTPFKAACCKETRCFMTAKRDEIPLNEFDAILFHHRQLFLYNLPSIRNDYQRWIFYEREPPPISQSYPETYDEDVFNWTMTYRLDSDVTARYGYVYPKEFLNGTTFQDLQWTPEEIDLKSKTKLIAWVVSHCLTSGKREEVVARLQKYIDVDVYGKCNNEFCNKSTCFQMIEKKYKFYLAFENSICKDYATEKYFRTLSLNIVPIVFGGSDYEYVSPPHSFIDARAFKSEKELAEHLLYLHVNETAYLSYFRWKKDFAILNTHTINFCNLCAKLHENNERKTYHHMREWFIGEAHCKNYS